MEKFFGLCFLPKSLRYFFSFEKGKSVEILRKAEISRDFLIFFRPISIKLSPILLVSLLIVSADAIRISADSLIVLTNTIRKNAHRKGIFFALSIERAVSSHSQRRKIRIVLTKNKESDQPEAEGARWLVATRGTFRRDLFYPLNYEGRAFVFRARS